jgi:hypothetical protein
VRSSHLPSRRRQACRRQQPCFVPASCEGDLTAPNSVAHRRCRDERRPDTFNPSPPARVEQKAYEMCAQSVPTSPLPSILHVITLSVFRLAARRADGTALIPLLEPAPVSEKPIELNRSPRRPGYTNLEIPFPVTSPPRSIMCRLMLSSWRSPSTVGASCAERNIRASFGVITTSPGLRRARSALGRSPTALIPIHRPPRGSWRVLVLHGLLAIT